MLHYRFLLLHLYIPLVFYTLWQAIKVKQRHYFFQRLGFGYGQHQTEKGLWFHAASVGEVNAIIPLLTELKQQSPQTPITLTTNTPTGAAIAEKQLADKIRHIYFPLDYRYALRRLFNHINPARIYIVETEFWPNFYTLASNRHIPLFIINGRVSGKTLHTRNWLKKLYAQILPVLKRVYARSETDRARFIQLGMPEERVEVTGNIKFAINNDDLIEPARLPRPYVLAASTRDNEEKVIIRAWLESEHADHLLVIAPRHIQRLTSILDDLKPFHLDIAVRSKNEAITDSTDLYIADTMGELKPFIAGAEFVIMGGSFVPKGGHNILEVAQQGKAVIFGPDMRSFSDEASLFLQHKAGVQCNPDALAGRISQMFSEREEYEKNTRQMMKDAQNILTKYLQLIESHT